ncbi:hypothetical protein [Pseudoalteromonas luteoviolacea]|uniref:hypothetical protein n=1 Tax=Pseudoalteromonas luteoviolacea TaxID=43657 RepID=UPI0007B06ED0|nr:hypothetical protein [Pseudoalteromonas luteoviolacea]KZN53911.1 hypothetical protein N474_18895 [Pseudoalteromonas luteoviolacea CPMOR-2]TQF70790.1 hypothetical protein FLM44_06790 [Pseudoalteromonas luteoviolacea]
MNVEIFANRSNPAIQNLLHKAGDGLNMYFDANNMVDIDYYLFIYLPCELTNKHIPPTLPKLVDYSNKHPDKTIFCFAQEQEVEQITAHQLKSIRAVGKLVEDNGARWLTQLPASLHSLFECRGA